MWGRQKPYTWFFPLILSITIKVMNKDFNNLTQSNLGMLIDSKRMKKVQNTFPQNFKCADNQIFICCFVT